MTRITRLRDLDARFPTSQRLDRSDAMSPDRDCSAADAVDAGFTFMKPGSLETGGGG